MSLSRKENSETGLKRQIELQEVIKNDKKNARNDWSQSRRNHKQNRSKQKENITYFHIYPCIKWRT